MKRLAQTLSHPFIVLTVGLFVGSMLMARGVYVIYPFSRFDMYARSNGNTASRLAIRDRNGQFTEPSQWEHYHCDAPLNLDPHRCGGDISSMKYLDREVSDHIAKHAAPSAEPGDESVTLVRRVWRIQAWVPEPQHAACELHVCTARRSQ